MKRRNTKTGQIAFIGLFASLALLLAYVEHLLPPVFAAVPGIKLGLPNIVILYVLYCIDLKHAALVSFIRILMSSILFGNAMTFAYSVAGAVLSLALMGILKKTDLLSAVGVSVVGGVSHNLGQILVAMVVLDTPQIAYYMIVLAITGTVSGIFVGLCGAMLVKRIPLSKMLKR